MTMRAIERRFALRAPPRVRIELLDRDGERFHRIGPTAEELAQRQMHAACCRGRFLTLKIATH